MQVCNGLCNQSKLYHDDRSSHKNASARITAYRGGGGAGGVDKILEILHIDQNL